MWVEPPSYRRRWRRGYPQISCSTSATIAGMIDTVGVRELRQQASELIRRAEAGEEIIVAVSGRPAARLVPLEAPRKLAQKMAQEQRHRTHLGYTDRHGLGR